MKHYIKIAGIILLNLFLVVLSAYIHEAYTLKIIRKTHSYDREMLIFFFSLIICIILFIGFKNFRKLSIGISSVIIYGMIYLHFYMNMAFASAGLYETFKLNSIHKIENKLTLNIDCSSYGSETEVTIDKYINVDSVQLRIDKGLLGMKILTTNVRIQENEKCQTPDSTNYGKYDKLINFANELRYNRCFDKAILLYSELIKNENNNFLYYYERGLTYMVQNKFDKALKDFITSFIIKYKIKEGKRIATTES